MRNVVVLVALAMLSVSAQAANMSNGEQVNKICAVCHGIYGQGAPGKLSPRIAGMPKEYLAKVTKDYRDGKRNYPLMVHSSGLKHLSERDIEDVSAYLSSLDVSSDPRFDIHPLGGNPARGEALYMEECKNCHAKDGYGRPKKEAPPLAGQYPAYLYRAMQGHKDRSRVHDNDPDDDSFEGYSDSQLINLTAHLARQDDGRKLAGYRFTPPNYAAYPPDANPARPGIRITDIRQTVVQIPLGAGIERKAAIDAMISRAVALDLKLEGHQDISKELKARGVESPYLSIFQFCDPVDAREMIIANPIFSSYMPCRISMVEDQNGKTWLMMLNLDMIINSKLLSPKVLESAVKLNTRMLDIMVAGASGER